MAMTPAERARKYRSRKKARKKGLLLGIEPAETADWLVATGRLAEWDSEDQKAVEMAATIYFQKLIRPA